MDRPEIAQAEAYAASALPARANRRMSLVVKDHFGLSVQAVTFPAKLLSRSFDSISPSFEQVSACFFAESSELGEQARPHPRIFEKFSDFAAKQSRKM
jgi:hypothetical protein